MNDEQRSAPKEATRRRVASFLVTLAGLVFGQALLYGPSLIGQKILLPVDLLVREGYYLPQTEAVRKVQPRNLTLTDQLEVFEPARRFAVSELRAGRLPTWAPYQFGGVPLIWPKFSPFFALQSLTASPIILAWSQLFAALVAGFGAYIFCRQVLGVSYWPATLAAWCHPLTAFFVLWQGFPTATSVYWLPWLLWATHQTARRASRWAPVGLILVTCLTLVSGHLDVAGQVLIVAGLYAAWCLAEASRANASSRGLGKVALTVALGFVLGFLLAAPYVLPVLEYSKTGNRMARRATGDEERPPIGLSTLPQIVLPSLYGSSQTASVRLDEGTESESAAAAYAGVVAALLVAPLAWTSRRHRSQNLFFLLLVVLGLAWCLNLPGFVQFMRLPGLNLFSHNRFVFASSFSLLALMAVGLEAVASTRISWQRWFWVPCGILSVLCAWCVYRSNHLPDELTTNLEHMIEQGQSVGLTHDLAGVRQVQSWFVEHYAVAALLCGLGVAGWTSVRLRPGTSSWRLSLLGTVLVGDLLWFAHGRSPQSDPALYFPPVSALDQLARSAPGRVIGYHCLPASLGYLRGLRDLRGYDGVDPQRMVELVELAADQQSTTRSYAQIEWLSPKVALTPDGNARLHPVLDLLGVGHVIFRHPPAQGARPAFQSDDYYILANPGALPRGFVPRRVEILPEKKARLQRLAASDFDPRDLAILESPVALPVESRGTVSLTSETPTRLAFSINMDTPGLVVVADRWDPGWRAYLNAVNVPILIADHAVRGVLAPAGEARLEFRYEPRSFTRGLALAGSAAVALMVWAGSLLKTSRGHPRPST